MSTDYLALALAEGKAAMDQAQALANRWWRDRMRWPAKAMTPGGRVHFAYLVTRGVGPFLDPALSLQLGLDFRGYTFPETAHLDFVKKVAINAVFDTLAKRTTTIVKRFSWAPPHDLFFGNDHPRPASVVPMFAFQTALAWDRIERARARTKRERQSAEHGVAWAWEPHIALLTARDAARRILSMAP